MKLTKFALLAVAAGCTLASQGVYAQAMEVVTVEAVREIVVGKSPIGAPIKELTIRSRVSYADLDLTTATGVATLEQRVKDARAQVTSAREKLQKERSAYAVAQSKSDVPAPSRLESAP